MIVKDIIKPNCKAPIGYLGGKTKLRTTIINCMPPHKAYIEVFCGSATVFFGKPFRKAHIEIVNDLHEDLTNLMKVISGTYFDEKIRQEFIGYVRTMPASKSAYDEWKKYTVDDITKLTPAQRAFRFYYCVKKGFSSVPKGGFESSPFSGNRYNMKTDFERFSKRFRESGAQIINADFVDCITKYNRSRASTFFFMDPPYFVADSTNYYDLVFDNEKHLKLKEMADEITTNKNTFLITYDDVTEVLDLYKDYHIYRTDPITYNAADEREERDLIKTELFVTNYDIAEMLANKSDDIFVMEDIKIDGDHIEIPGHIGLHKVKI